MGGHPFQGGREPRDGLTVAYSFDYRLRSTHLGSPWIDHAPASNIQGIACLRDYLESDSAVSVPDPHRIVLGPADNAAAVLIERHTCDPSLVSTEAEKLATAVHVPDPHCLVFRPTDDSATFAVERHARNPVIV